MRAALDVGIVVGWNSPDRVFAQRTDRSRAQRVAFDALTDNPHAPAVLLGTYYAGFSQRWWL